MITKSDIIRNQIKLAQKAFDNLSSENASYGDEGGSWWKLIKFQTFIKPI